MNTSTGRLLGSLAIVAAVLLAEGSLVSAASPSPTAPASPPSGPTGEEMLSVQPSLIGLKAAPGASTSVKLTLRAAVDLDIVVQSQGLAQGTDGNFQAVAEPDDKSPYSARSMLSASPSSFHLSPGQTTSIDVAITVPADVGDGTRYAILTITGTPAAGPIESDNVGFGVELGVSTLIQIAETEQAKLGEIKDIALASSLPGQPLPIKVAFENTGNSHYGALPNELLTTALLLDSTNAQIATASASGNQLSVIPSFRRVIDLSMVPDTALVDGGTYHLEVGVGLKDGTIFDRKAIEFTWSGGQILGPTGAPVEGPPVKGAGGSDIALLAGGALLLAGLFLLLLLAAWRVRRRHMAATGAGRA